MVKKIRNISALITIIVLVMSGTASAQSELATSSGDPLANLSQSTFPYAIAGGPWEIPLLVRDSAHCGRDDPSVGIVGNKVDILLRNSDGQFSSWRSVTISQDMVEDKCSMLGYVVANPGLVFAAPHESQEFRVSLSDPSGQEISRSDSAHLYIAFWQEFSFRPNPSAMGFKKEQIFVKMIGDRRLVGIRATFFWRERGSRLYRPLAHKKISLRHKRGEVSFRKRATRSGGRAYVCLDYASLYPKMWTGNSCPTKPVMASTLEKLFPLSTSG